MKKTNQKISYSGDTILCFHIGRGGRFHNPGFLTLKSAETEIMKTSAFNNLFIDEDAKPEDEYRDASGNPIGLTVAQAESGIGMIDIDGGYDTTYTTKIADLSEAEINAVIDYKGWEKEIIVNTLIELGIVDEDEPEEAENE